MDMTDSVLAPKPNGRQTRLMTLAIALSIVSYIFFVNAWVSDDAYITFRVSQNVLEGFGPRWNIDERVQVYTNPLLMLVAIPLHLLPWDIYYSAILLGYACTVFTIVQLGRSHNWDTISLCVIGVLCSSQAFVDFSSSGLENPLSGVLLVFFWRQFFALLHDDFREDRITRNVSLGAAILFLNRHDHILLVAPTLAYVALRRARSHGRIALRSLLTGLLLAGGWIAFSVFYYGFPFPNTFYAKLSHDYSSSVVHEQGILYLIESAVTDPITLATIVACSIFACVNRSSVWPVVGIPLYLAYIVSIGGDFMNGRFLTAPLVSAVAIALNSSPKGELYPHPFDARFAAFALALYNILLPLVPIKALQSTTPARSSPDFRCMWNERRVQAPNSLWKYTESWHMPIHAWANDGRGMKSRGDRIAFVRGAGMFAYYAGSQSTILDWYALGDPLRSRLAPLRAEVNCFPVGHLPRPLPFGYMQYRSGQRPLPDIDLRHYAEHLRLLVAGDLISFERLRAIFDFNFGSYRTYNRYLKQRYSHVTFEPLDVSFSQDFDDGSISGWFATGAAFMAQPVRDDSGAKSGFYINSYRNSNSRFAPSDAPTGNLISPEFTVTKPYLRFLIGGGCDLETERVELLVGGVSRLAATGRCLESLAPVTWDVRELIGQRVALRLVDSSSNPWGHINFDSLQSGRDPI